MNLPETQKEKHCGAQDDSHYTFSILQHDALEKVPIFLFNCFENLAAGTSGRFSHFIQGTFSENEYGEETRQLSKCCGMKKGSREQ